MKMPLFQNLIAILSLMFLLQQNLYDSFVSARDREERGDFARDGRGSDGKPRQGHTIYVYGYHISEEVLKKAFSTFGNIVNVNMEIEKK